MSKIIYIGDVKYLKTDYLNKIFQMDWKYDFKI